MNDSSPSVLSLGFDIIHKRNQSSQGIVCGELNWFIAKAKEDIISLQKRAVAGNGEKARQRHRTTRHASAHAALQLVPPHTLDFHLENVIAVHLEFTWRSKKTVSFSFVRR